MSSDGRGGTYGNPWVVEDSESPPPPPPPPTSSGSDNSEDSDSSGHFETAREYRLYGTPPATPDTTTSLASVSSSSRPSPAKTGFPLPPSPGTAVRVRESPLQSPLQQYSQNKKRGKDARQLQKLNQREIGPFVTRRHIQELKAFRQQVKQQAEQLARQRRLKNYRELDSSDSSDADEDEFVAAEQPAPSNRGKQKARAAEVSLYSQQLGHALNKTQLDQFKNSKFFKGDETIKSALTRVGEEKGLKALRTIKSELIAAALEDLKQERQLPKTRAELQAMAQTIVSNSLSGHEKDLLDKHYFGLGAKKWQWKKAAVGHTRTVNIPQIEKLIRALDNGVKTATELVTQMGERPKAATRALAAATGPSRGAGSGAVTYSYEVRISILLPKFHNDSLKPFYDWMENDGLASFESESGAAANIDIAGADTIYGHKISFEITSDLARKELHPGYHISIDNTDRTTYRLASKNVDGGWSAYLAPDIPEPAKAEVVHGNLNSILDRDEEDEIESTTLGDREFTEDDAERYRVLYRVEHRLDRFLPILQQKVSYYFPGIDIDNGIEFGWLLRNRQGNGHNEDSFDSVGDEDASTEGSNVSNLFASDDDLIDAEEGAEQGLDAMRRLLHENAKKAGLKTFTFKGGDVSGASDSSGAGSPVTTADSSDTNRFMPNTLRF